MKEEKPIFFKAFALVTFILLINIAVFTYNSKDSIDFNKGLTGFLVNEVISDNNSKLNPFAKILIIVQWSFLGLILIFASVRDKGFKKQKIELESIKINPSKQQTDLDKLYAIIKERKQIKVKNISKLFGVEFDVALEWAKILESGNLAEIDYPIFGGPILNLKIEKNKDKDIQTNKKQNLNKEQLKNNLNKTKKNKNLLILFIIIFGFAIYPIYWMYNNNWNYKIIPQNTPTLILTIISLFFTFIFLVIIIKRIFTKKKKQDIKTKEIKQISKAQIQPKTKLNPKINSKEKKQPETKINSKKKKPSKPKKKTPSKSKRKK